MGAPENGHGGGAGNGAPEMPGRPPAGGAAQDVDYAWLQEQLAALGMQLGNARIEDEIEDEVGSGYRILTGLLFCSAAVCNSMWLARNCFNNRGAFSSTVPTHACYIACNTHVWAAAK